MARLQDFQPVTPTDSDNLLVVQATGQGLATVGSTLGAKMDKANPEGTGSLSLNKLSGSALGTNSVSIGQNNTASGDQSFAEGRETVASGNQSHAEGYQTTASMTRAHSEGSNTVASGTSSHAEGSNTIANHLCQHVFGEYNLADTSTAQPSSRGNYAEIVGNGTSDSSRSNARTLDWNGNEVLAGGLKINGTQDVVQQVRFSIPKSSSKTVTVGQDLGIVSFLVSATGNAGVLNHFLFFVSGYATASRCLVSTLVNTTGASQFTITATNTSNTIFTFNNLNATNAVQVSIIPLFNNTFTIT